MLPDKTFNIATVLILAMTLVACGGGANDGANTVDGGNTVDDGNTVDGGNTVDDQPDTIAFSPAVRENVAPGLSYLTPEITIAGIDSDVSIQASAEGAEQLLVNGQAMTGATADLQVGDTVILRVKAPDSFGAESTATLTVAGQQSTHTLKTGTSDLQVHADRAKKALVFEWDELDVTRYRILHNPDGNSGFSPLMEVLALTGETRAEVPIAVAQVDWENAAFAIEACLSADSSCKILPGHEFVTEQARSLEMIDYLKTVPPAGELTTGDMFGDEIALSGDGQVLAVAVISDKGETDVDAGAVQIFRRADNGWVFETELTEPDVSVDVPFGGNVGDSLALNANATVLAVAQAAKTPGNEGRSMIYRRDDAGWTLEETFTPTGTEAMTSVALSGSGGRLVTGSAALGVYDRQADGSWTLTQTVNNGLVGNPGDHLALSEDGRTLIVSKHRAGPATRQGEVFAYFDADDDGQYETPPVSLVGENGAANDFFGSTVALSANGRMLLVGASGEDADRSDPATNGDDTPLEDSGAAYVFIRASETNTWQQVDYLKAPNADAFDYFGTSVAVSDDGRWMAVGAEEEAGAQTGVHHAAGTVLDDNTGSSAGAVYLYERVADDDWVLRRYVKSPDNTEADGYLGFGEHVALSGDGATLVVSASDEDGAGTGINDGDPGDNNANESGAVYIY